MSAKQLYLIADLEQKKEDKLAQQFGEIQQILAQQQQKLVGLTQYLRDYMQTVVDQGKGGITSASMARFQAFVGQLEKACEQQRATIKQTEKVVEQRRALWLQQQRKRKSIQLVIEKQEKLQQAKRDREEQKMFDEFVTNQAARR